MVRQENQSEAEPAPDSKDCRQAGSASWPGSRSVLQQAVQASLAAPSFDQVIYINAVSRSEAERQADALTKLFSDRGYKTVLTQDRRQTGRKESSKSKYLTGNNLRMAFSERRSPHNLHL